MPESLPAPVARFFKCVLGEQVPLIHSAVISGRGTLRFKGITFPARWRFTHCAGKGYRHYIEATVLGYPLMKVNERFLDGHARMELPVGVIENEPKVDSAANLGLWGESIWLPSIFLTDARVRWESLNETSARLIVPAGDAEDSFTASFDAHTGLLRRLETLRYRAASDVQKIGWRNEVLEWKQFHGINIPRIATVTWLDEATPWLILVVEEVAYNVDVSQYLKAAGI